MQRMSGSSATAFHSAENKAVLWAALQEAGAFDNLAPGMERQVMGSIETRMVDAGSALSSSGDTRGSRPPDLTVLNKAVLKAVMADLSRSTMSNARAGMGAAPTAIERAFVGKQAEIEAMAKGTRPRQIDFSDEVDQPMGGAMDRAVQEAMNRRNVQLAASQAQHAGTRHSAEKWLGIQEQNRVQTQQQQQTVRPLKIGGLVPGNDVGALPITDAHNVTERRVRFTTQPESGADTGAQRFLSSLKRDDVQSGPVSSATGPVSSATGPVSSATGPVSSAPSPLHQSLSHELPQLDGINESLKRIADGLTELIAAMNENGTLPTMPCEPPSPSPVSSPGSGPAEIDLSPEGDGDPNN